MNKKSLVILGIAGILLLATGTGIYFHNKNVKQQIIIKERENEKKRKGRKTGRSKTCRGEQKTGIKIKGGSY